MKLRLEFDCVRIALPSLTACSLDHWLRFFGDANEAPGAETGDIVVILVPKDDDDDDNAEVSASHYQLWCWSVSIILIGLRLNAGR